MFRLALALGKHLHEIEALPAREVMRWAAYDAQEPIGEVRSDLRMARLAQAFTGHKDPLDFVFFLTEDDRNRIKMEKQMATVKGWAARGN
ncbi:MAG: hypothetical protein AAF607_06200 [Pseudomonadota bacterium]